MGSYPFEVISYLFYEYLYHRVDIKTPLLALTPLSNFLEILENNLTPFSTLEISRAKRARKKSGFGPFYKGETCFKVTNLGVPKRSHIITPLQLLENFGK